MKRTLFAILAMMFSAAAPAYAQQGYYRGDHGGGYREHCEEHYRGNVPPPPSRCGGPQGPVYVSPPPPLYYRGGYPQQNWYRGNADLTICIACGRGQPQPQYPPQGGYGNYGVAPGQVVGVGPLVPDCNSLPGTSLVQNERGEWVCRRYNR